jgi:ribonuclease III
MSLLTDCQKQINHQYNNIDLLQTALTHRSYLNEDRNTKESNERVEYLGDAVLELITSEFLYQTFPKSPEGELTALRAKIVQTRTLAAVATRLELGKYLRMSRGETASGGATNSSLLADTVEAIIGSIYLDAGFEMVKKFIQKNILKNYKELIEEAEVEDWKSQLQELVQAKGGIAPTYEVVNEDGPDHDRTFTVIVNYFDKPQETGAGRSKQSAQQAAAHKALEKLSTLK